MKKTIYLVRHAESKTNVDPTFEGEDVLSEEGSKQAISVAPRFKNLRIECVYTSKILRAKLTGEEICKVTGVEAVVYDFLGERKGKFDSNNEYSYAESFDELKERMNKAKTLLEDENSPRKIVVVSHAIFLRSLASYLILNDLLTEDVLHNMDQSLMVSNTGVSKLVFDTESKKWVIMSWNDLAHLAE